MTPHAGCCIMRDHLRHTSTPTHMHARAPGSRVTIHTTSDADTPGAAVPSVLLSASAAWPPPSIWCSCSSRRLTSKTCGGRRKESSVRGKKQYSHKCATLMQNRSPKQGWDGKEQYTALLQACCHPSNKSKDTGQQSKATKTINSRGRQGWLSAKNTRSHVL